MNMHDWKRSIIAAKEVKAIPVMTYPGLQVTGLKIMDVVTDGSRQSAIVEALAHRYPAAAAVTMMDLSVEAEVFGSTIVFSEVEVPTAVGAVVSDLASARVLAVPAIGDKRTGEYLKGMACAAKAITDRPVFGGCIGPFSLAGRLLDINKAILATRRDPDVVHAVLARCSAFLTAYLQAIKDTGVDGVVMAEPLAGLLSPAGCGEFSADYVRDLVSSIQDDHFTVILHNCGNAAKQVETLASTGAAALHFGNSVRMSEILPQVPADLLACGNVDPAGIFRMGTPVQVEERTTGLLEDMRGFPNFVLSSGCDIPPNSPIENLDAFFAALDRFNHRPAAAPRFRGTIQADTTVEALRPYSLAKDPTKVG